MSIISQIAKDGSDKGRYSADLLQPKATKASIKETHYLRKPQFVC